MPKITPIPWQDFDHVLLKAGCYYDHTIGDHRIYKRSDLKRPIVIPQDDDVPVFIIKNNIKTLGISRDEYFSYLSEK